MNQIPFWRIVKCRNCGEKFELDEDEARREICSQECRNQRAVTYTQRYRRRSGRYGKPLDRTCVYCGEVFEVIKGEGDHRKFCSKDCFRKSESERTSKYVEYRQEYQNHLAARNAEHRASQVADCAVCGGSFNPRASSHRICSDSCRRIDRARRQRERYHGQK